MMLSEVIKVILTTRTTLSEKIEAFHIQGVFSNKQVLIEFIFKFWRSISPKQSHVQ